MMSEKSVITFLCKVLCGKGDENSIVTFYAKYPSQNR